VIDCTPPEDGAHGPPLAWVSSLVAAARAERLSWSVLWEVLLAHLESDERAAASAVAALLEHVREPRDPACAALRLSLMLAAVDQAVGVDPPAAPVSLASQAAQPARETAQVDGPARAPMRRRSDSDWFVLIEPSGIP
jgi:hypothetical protein